MVLTGYELRKDGLGRIRTALTSGAVAHAIVHDSNSGLGRVRTTDLGLVKAAS